MATKEKTSVTVESTVKAPIEKVWKYFNEPDHIKKWAFASDDWHAPYSENDIRTNGKFKTTMAAKDGSVSFDFEGIYSNVQPNKLIEYEMADGGGLVGSANEAAGKSAAMSMTPSNGSRSEIRRLIALPLNHASWRNSTIVVSHTARIHNALEPSHTSFAWQQQAVSSKQSRSDDRGDDMRDRRIQ